MDGGVKRLDINILEITHKNMRFLQILCTLGFEMDNNASKTSICYQIA